MILSSATSLMGLKNSELSLSSPDCVGVGELDFKLVNKFVISGSKLFISKFPARAFLIASEDSISLISGCTPNIDKRGVMLSKSNGIKFSLEFLLESKNTTTKIIGK